MLARVVVEREHAPLLIERLIGTYGKPRVLQDFTEPTILFVEFLVEDKQRQQFRHDWERIKVEPEKPNTRTRLGVGNLMFYQAIS